MADEKEVDPPMYTITGSQSGSISTKRSYKKYVIIAVSCILVAAIILTAILVGMYLFTKAQQDLIKFTYNQNQNTKEDVASDPNANTVQFHVNSNTYELWVIDDFNRDIQVMKVIEPGYGTNCFLAPLNRTTALDPSKVHVPADLDPKTQNATYSLNYYAADTPVSDISFLGKSARDMCNGISTYWLFASCEDPSTEMNRRQKRCWRGCRSGTWWVVQWSLCWRVFC